MRWQDDKAFCDWLLGEKYARKEKGVIKPYLSGGAVLYMHEAWSSGKDEANKPVSVACQCASCVGLREKNGSLLAG